MPAIPTRSDEEALWLLAIAFANRPPAIGLSEDVPPQKFI
jgi:hypothetical protein